MTQARLLKTSREILNIAPAHGKKFRLAELQTYVGGYIEIVPLNGGLLMIANEEGLIHDLPLNANASVIAEQRIVGDVVVCDRDQMH